MRHPARLAPLHACAAGLALLSLASSPVGADENDVIFTDVAGPAGLDLQTFYSPTFHSLGLSWIDVNADTWADLFVVNGSGGLPSLFLNNQDGTFTDRSDLLPVTPIELEMAGAVFGDYDNDGDSDIYVFNQHEFNTFGPGNPADGPPNMLWQSQFVENGNQLPPNGPLFVDVAAAAGVDLVVDPPFGVDYDGTRSVTGGFFDYDRDGHLDLYVGQWAGRHGGELSNKDVLFRNNGDGTFTDVTDVMGLPDGSVAEDLRPTLVFIAAHLDDDLWPDMFVITNADVYDPWPPQWDPCDDLSCPTRWLDFIFENQDGNGFVDVLGNSPGVGNDTGSGMGMDIADVDLDGDWDVYVSDIENSKGDASPGNVFYRGSGPLTWHDNEAPQLGMVSQYSWAVNFLDIDQDGYEDLYCGTRTTDNVFYNTQGAGFIDVGAQAGFGDPADGDARGAATCDFDHDGDLDLAIVQINGKVRLMRNDSTNQGHWLKLKLFGNGIVDPNGRNTNVDAVGALVEIDVAGNTHMRQIKSGTSSHSQDDLVLHFGIGDATVVDEMRVFWPSGKRQVFTGVTADTFYTLVEPLPLAADANAVSLSAPQPVALALSAGDLYANELYFVLGSVSGDSPGFPIDDVTLPLNIPDPYFNFTAANPNSGLLKKSLGFLGPFGDAGATFTLPGGLDPLFAGVTLHHAYLVFRSTGAAILASNAVGIELVN